MAKSLSRTDPWSLSLLNRDFIDPWGIDDRLSRFFDTTKLNMDSPMDIYETEKDLTFQVAFPGVPLENWNIEITDNILTIKGKKEAEELQENTKYYKKAWSFESKNYSASYRLPNNLESKDTLASYKDGVLKITIPKVEKEVETSFKINVK